MGALIMKNKKLVRFIGLFILTIIFAGCSSNKEQQEEPYPTKQIEYVVCAGPGGVTDLTARAAAEYISKDWGQPILVINKPGAGNVVGLEYGLKQGKPDGYTVVTDNVSSSVLMLAGMVNPPIKIDDRIFVSKFVEDPICIAVKADAPWNDLDQFNDWVKKNPEKLTRVSVGTTGINALTAAKYLNAIGVDPNKTTIISSKSGSESVALVAGGHAILNTSTVSELYPLVKAGKIRILAVTSSERSRYYPNAPTCKELGVDIESTWWGGISLPKGTPNYIVKKWDAVVEKMVKDPVFIEQMDKIHTTVSYMNTTDYNNFIKSELENFTRLTEGLGLRK
jgi:tripartite-type tricarboxylate transporter receptor subunit TctC